MQSVEDIETIIRYAVYEQPRAGVDDPQQGISLAELRDECACTGETNTPLRKMAQE